MRNIDKRTCWYDKNLHTSVNPITAKEPALLQLTHGRVLKELFDLIPISAKTVLDIGCGNAKAHTIIGSRVYTGLDLLNNICTIGRVNYPNLEFTTCDILEDNLSFISEYDIVLMNAFIDVMEWPVYVLIKILKECKGYVILHRQEITDGRTKIITNPSYTGFTYHSVLSRHAFDEVLETCNFKIVIEMDAGFGGNWRSFLLKRINNEIC